MTFDGLYASSARAAVSSCSELRVQNRTCGMTEAPIRQWFGSNPVIESAIELLTVSVSMAPSRATLQSSPHQGPAKPAITLAALPYSELDGNKRISQPAAQSSSPRPLFPANGKADVGPQEARVFKIEEDERCVAF